MKIALSGSHGFIGSNLKDFLKNQGHEVYPLVRTQAQQDEIYWNPDEKVIESEKLEGLDAVIHLAGENIFQGRWTEENKEKIRSSRAQGTTFLSETLMSLQHPPRTFLHASAIGYYGDRGPDTLTEVSLPGGGFLADVCRGWEDATAPIKNHGIRIVTMRFGVVMSPKGGILKEMLFPFKMCLGGVIGSGRQYMSWIALEDLMSAIQFALEQREMKGPLNFTAPNPVTNREFTKTLGAILNRPTILPLPSFLARLFFGEMADELMLSSTRAVPKRLLQAGFTFKYPMLEDALEAMIR
jgi:uncharacterized protein (TIGR01777 family)